jgi:hypothetical protein
MPKQKSIHRQGYFLRLYGPPNARTKALLVRGHGPRPDTPEGFAAELDAEYGVEAMSKSTRIATEWVLHLAGRPRLSLPSYGSTTRRVLNMIWAPCVSKPPLVCAGKRQFPNGTQARVVAGELGQEYEACPFCNTWHLFGRRRPQPQPK